VTGDVAVGSSFTEIEITGTESFAEAGALEGDGNGINTAYSFAEQSGDKAFNRDSLHRRQRSY